MCRQRPLWPTTGRRAPLSECPLRRKYRTLIVVAPTVLAYIHRDQISPPTIAAKPIRFDAAANTNGDSVTLLGFGTFNAAPRAARESKNPETGEKLSLVYQTEREVMS